MFGVTKYAYYKTVSNVTFTYIVHHKSRLELKHVTAVGDLVEAAAAAAINLHLNRCTLQYSTLIRCIFEFATHERQSTKTT